MAKWLVQLEVEEDVVRRHQDQRGCDIATTESDVRDFVSDVFAFCGGDRGIDLELDSRDYSIIDASKIVEAP